MRNLITICILLLITGCDTWEEHYVDPGGNLEINLWEAISADPAFSAFVELAEQYSIDTIFETNNAYTVFVPGNEGMNSVDFDQTDPVTFLKSHIASTLFLTRNITNETKLQTLSGKFAVLKEDQDSYFFNNTLIASQSDLHYNGIYYSLEGASQPFDNLFQYVERINPSIAAYIESQDSVYLDLEKSKPVDINAQGEIIYDSVMISINLFELLYFPLSEEFRDNRATLVIPTEEQYELALDEVRSALNLDATFEIPKVWQYDVLIPFILDHGLFEDELAAVDFSTSKLKNIRGDSVIISYAAENMYECSNGVAYQYDDFSIPDSLYLEGYRQEGEYLAESQGLGLFAWKSSEIVRITGETSFAPTLQRVNNIASNDSILFVDFGNNFTGAYDIEFRIENVFPGQYQFIWRSNPRFGGVYAVYINGEQQELPFGFDEFDLDYLRNGVVSVTGQQYFYPENGYNKLDCLATIEEFGDVWVRLEYIGPGKNDDNGLIIDYVELVPYN